MTSNVQVLRHWDLFEEKALMAKGPEEGEEEEASAPDPTPAQPKLAKKGNTIPGT